MPNGTEKITDLLSAPMEAVIVTMGAAIARAQRELDRHSLETQREINEDPQLADLGLQATWYQMPRTELELTMAIAMEQRKAPATGVATPAPEGPRVLQKYPLRQIYFQPVNATYSNQFAYNVNAASKIKLAIVPVPPPAADAGVAPRLTRDEVTRLVQPLLVDDPAVRLSMTFNGQVRLWYVMQHKQVGDQTQRLLLVVVDDETRAIVKQVKGS